MSEDEVRSRRRVDRTHTQSQTDLANPMRKESFGIEKLVVYQKAITINGQVFIGIKSHPKFTPVNKDAENFSQSKI